MVSSNCVNLLDLVAKCCSLVDEQLKEFMRGRFPREEFKLLVDGATPSYDNPRGDLYVIVISVSFTE